MDILLALTTPSNGFYLKIAEGDYGPVQQKFDDPYIINPAPSRYLEPLLSVYWLKRHSDSIRLLYQQRTYAKLDGTTASRSNLRKPNQPLGWFMFEHLTDSIVPELREPAPFHRKDQ